MNRRPAIPKVPPTRLVSANPDRRVLPAWLKTLVDNVSDHPQDPRHIIALHAQLSNDHSWFAHPTILMLVLRQFDIPLPSPAQPLNSVLDHTDIISGALDGVSFALQTTEYKVLPEIMICWPAIWKWMVYLYQQHTVARGVGRNAGRNEQYLGSALDIPSTVERAFAFMIPPYDNSNPIISSTPGALELSLKMWFRQADRPSDDVALVWGITGLSQAVTFLFTGLKDDRVREIMTFMGPNQTNLGKRLHDPLRAVVYRDIYLMNAYPKLMFAYSALVIQVPTLLQDPRQVEEILSCIHHAYSHVPPSPLNVPHDQRKNVHMIIASSCGFLWNISHDVAQNAAWVLQFLQARLLECLVRTAPYHDNGMVHVSVAVALQELRLYMLYRPIVKCFYQTMTSDAFVMLVAGMSQHQKFWSIWSYFEQKVRDAWTTQLEFKSSGLYKRKCGSAECETAEGLVPFQVCSKCKYVRYCSRTCQTSDWHKHRKMCGQKKSDRDYLTSPKTIAYFTYVVDKELKSSRKAIVTDRDRLLADITRQPLILIYDYTRECKIVPPKYTMGRLQDIYPGLTPKLPPTHPVIIPLVRLQCGKIFEHVPLPASKTSGELFGWYRRDSIIGDEGAKVSRSIDAVPVD